MMESFAVVFKRAGADWDGLYLFAAIEAVQNY